MEDLSARLQDARKFLLQKAYRESHSICLAVLQQQPQKGEAYFLLGVLTADHQNYAKALELFQTAMKNGHQIGEAEAQAARCLIALNRRDEAVEMAHAAAALSPSDPLVLDTIGVVLSRAGHHEQALPYYERAVAAAPQDAGFQYNLGAALQFLGRFEAAKRAFRACLDARPEDSRALVALASMGEQLEDGSMTDRLQAAWEARNTADADQTLQLAHALARAFEDAKEPLTAMSWLEKGKQAKRATLQPRAQDDAECFAAAARTAIAHDIDENSAADGPIFIVGMPRTGTTLTDRILSSHPLVTSAGELSDFSVALKRQAKTPGAYVLDAATLDASLTIDLPRLGAAYLDKVSATLGLTGRFTDKMPLNAFFAPTILAAIPNARIVCLRRHPADTVLSNYRQLFATSFSYYAYAYDLEATAHYVVQFYQLMDHYAAHLPASRFKIQDYEAMVADQDGQTRALLDFCGLDFDPACLSFHENDAPVATASATQVRKPLYSSSIDRWKSYRPAIDPALEILRAGNLLDSL